MTNKQVRQIMGAIREHTRAMVVLGLLHRAPKTVMVDGGFPTDITDEQAYAWAAQESDALLAALSASSGPSREWLARMGDAEAGCQVTAAGLAADVGLVSESSASSGGENDAADGATGADTALAQGAEVTAEGPSGVRKTEPNAQAATPPLSAEAAADAYGLNEYETVTVRRDDLRTLLERHGSPRFPHAPEWFFRIREAVGR